MPDYSEKSAQGVSLRGQTGQEAVCDFDSIIAGLPVALREAFYAERSAQQAEFDAIIEVDGYHS